MNDSSDELLDETATPRPKEDQPAPEASLPVADKDRYVIERELGQGGQSVVYAARDTALDREVALKTVRRGGGAIAHFLREARITGQLEHPGIVPVHELGRTAGGEFYVTQKLVRGRTLRQALEAATTLEARLALLPHFIDLCNAVAYAHSRQVVHRDLKPENVMVGEFGETVVLDWGVARVLDGSEPEPTGPGEKLAEVKPLQTIRRLSGVTSGATAHGTVVGTPLYMSPEQARGEVASIDARSDVWSLGVMLYELLAFVRPFDARDVRTLLADVGRGIARPVTEVSADVPPELAAIISHALQPDRDRRLADARVLAQQLADYRAGKRVASYQYSSRELVQRFVSRNRALTAVTLIALVALAGSELYAWWLVGARDAAVARGRAETGAALAANGRAAVEVRDWNLALALFSAASELDVPGAARAAAGVAPLTAPVEQQAELVPVSARGPGAFDVDSRRALLAAPGRGLFVVERETPWHLLENTTEAEQQPLPAAIARGGASLAWRAGVVRLASIGGPTRALEGTERAAALAFSGDGQVLAVALPGTVECFGAATGERARSLASGPEQPLGLAVNPEGTRVAVTGADRSVRWWGPDGAGHALEPTRGAVSALAFSRDGRLLFLGREAGEVEVRDVERDVTVRTLQGAGGRVTALTTSTGGRWLAAGTTSGAALLWQLETGRLLGRFTAGEDELRAVSLAQDGSKLGALDRAGRRTAWDLRGMAHLGPFAQLDEGPVWALAEGRDGLWARTSQALFFVDGEGTVRWREPLSRGTELLGHGEGVLVGKPGQLELYGREQGTVLRSTKPCRATAWTFAAAPDGETLWVACGVELVPLDARTLEPKGAPLTAKTPVRHLALSPTGARLAWLAEDGTAVLLELPSRREVERWTTRGPQALAFDGTGQLLVIASREGVVLRHGVTGGEVRKLTLLDPDAVAAGFGYQSTAVWLASPDGLRLWSVHGGPAWPMPGIHAEVTAAALAPSGAGVWLGDAEGRLFYRPL